MAVTEQVTANADRNGTNGPHPPVGETVRECVMVGVVTVAYFLTRGLVRGRESDAYAHARQILALEQGLRLDPEHGVQDFGLGHLWLVHLADNFYLVAHLPVLLAVAIWVYWWHHAAYRWFRNAFLFSALIGLSIYVLYPVAPPRFMPGFVDTMDRYGFNVDGSAAGPFYNPFAAMPSLHVGWALLAGIAIVLCARLWWLRVAGASIPILMTLAVTVTGNHYLLDAVAGAIVVLIALALASWAKRFTPLRRSAA